MAYTIRSTKSWDETMRDLDETFRKWGVVEWYTLPRRPDLRKRWWTKEERLITVVFVRSGQEQRFSLGSQERPIDNLRALYLGIESMRMNEVRGIGEIVREMYLQLPAPAKERDPYDVLQVNKDAPMALIDAAYRALAKERHPDSGGSVEAFKELQAAYEAVKQERAAKPAGLIDRQA